MGIGLVSKLIQRGAHAVPSKAVCTRIAGDEVTVINHLSTGMWGSDFLHGFESWWSGKLLYAARL